MIRLPHNALVRMLAVAAGVAMPPFGLRAEDGVRTGLNLWVASALPNNIDAVKGLGLQSARVSLSWEQVQPQPGRFEWDRFDRVMKVAGENNIRVLFLVRSISSWGTVVAPKAGDSLHGASSPKSMADWEKFIRAVASRYKGKGAAYEIENEVNSNFWAGNLADCLALLRTSYRAIKAEDPDAIVLPSSLACGLRFDFRTKALRDHYFERSDEWFRAILATRAFDAVSVHDYYLPDGKALNGWTFSSYLRHAKELIAEAGVQDRAVWITETGYLARDQRDGRRIDEGSPEKQAAWLGQAFRQARAANVARVYWLFLRDSDLPYWGAMGLMDVGGRPRPAAKVFKDVAASQGSGAR